MVPRGIDFSGLRRLVARSAPLQIHTRIQLQPQIHSQILVLNKECRAANSIYVLYLKIPVKHGKKSDTALENDLPFVYPGLQLLLNVVHDRPVRLGGTFPRGARNNPR